MVQRLRTSVIEVVSYRKSKVSQVSVTYLNCKQNKKLSSVENNIVN